MTPIRKPPAPNDFQERLRQFMRDEGGKLPSGRSLSTSQAAQKLAELSKATISETDFKKWEVGASVPPYEDWPKISRALGEVPSFIANSLRAIPDDGDLARRVLQLVEEHEGWMRRLTKLHTDSWEECRQTALKMLQAALRQSAWTVAVTPAEEGPPGYQFHVADRIDVAPLRGNPVDQHALQSILREVGGGHIKSRHKKLKTGWEKEKPEDTQKFSVSFTSPARPPLPMEYVREAILNPIQVVSVSLTTWPADIASLLACALGHGFLSTRYLAQENAVIQPQPERASASEMAGKQAESHMRDTYHQQFLRDPRSRYVWAHFPGPYSTMPYLPDPGSWPSDLISIVILLEDSSRENRYARRVAEGEERGYYPDKMRELVDSHKLEEECHERLVGELDVHSNEKNLIVVRVAPAVRHGEPQERDDCWVYTFETTAVVLDELVDRGFVPRGHVTDVAKLSDFHQQWWRWAEATGRAARW